jgi:WD40 repeat protein
VWLVDTTVVSVHLLWTEADSPYSNTNCVGFTADGRYVLAYHDLRPNASVVVHDLNTGTSVRDYRVIYHEACEVGPGGRLVYVATVVAAHRGLVEIVRWNPLTGEKLRPFGRHAYSIQKLAVSGDEKWVAGSNGEIIRVWNLGGKKLPSRATRQLTIPQALVVELALSFDGAYFAAQTLLWTGGTVHLGDVRTGEVWKVADHSRLSGKAIAFHPARALLAYSGGGAEVAFYDAASRAELKRFVWDIGNITAMAFSPDGLRCAAAAHGGKIVIWDVDA